MEIKYSKFISLFEEFEDIETTTFQLRSGVAEDFLPSILKDTKCYEYLWYLMTAHLCKLNTLGDDELKDVTNTSVGSVSVGYNTLNSRDDSNFATWLKLTRYGKEYLAYEQRCIKSQASAGKFFGGLPEGKAFRKVGGVF